MFHCPEVLQVLELAPDLVYPLLHVKEATVYTGYPPATAAKL